MRCIENFFLSGKYDPLKVLGFSREAIALRTCFRLFMLHWAVWITKRYKFSMKCPGHNCRFETWKMWSMTVCMEEEESEDTCDVNLECDDYVTDGSCLCNSSLLLLCWTV